jgi:hypothetical protein
MLLCFDYDGVIADSFDSLLNVCIEAQATQHTLAVVTFSRPYNTSGHWFKGNTHLHSTASDGRKTFPALAELYHAEGYDFLFRTDHWIASDTTVDAMAYPLLWMDGIELDGCDGTGAYFHVVCLGKVDGICRDNGFEAALRSARE